MVQDFCVTVNFLFLLISLIVWSNCNPPFSLVLQYDPFAEHRPQKIVDREDEYKARRRQMIISPERLDPFADGKFHATSPPPATLFVLLPS